MPKGHPKLRNQKINKRYRRLVEAAIARGWVLSYEGKHPKLTAPNGDVATPIPSKDHQGLEARFRKLLTTHSTFLEDPLA